MQKQIAILLWVIALAICTCACMQNAADTPTNVVASISSSSPPADQPSNEFYPFTAGYTWLDAGETLVVPNGGTIQYVGLDNRVKSTVTLPQEALIGDCRYSFFENRILVMGGYDPGDFPGQMTACLLDGKWELTNGSIWDGTGKPLREFSRYIDTYWPEGGRRRELSDGRALPEELAYSAITQVAWVNEDLIVLDGSSRLFFYRLSTDKLTLVDDMSEWMDKFGKMRVYYGIQSIFPYGDGAFYFAHKNVEKSNTAGTVWFADETGIRELFDGQEFQNCMGNDTMLVLVSCEGSEEPDKANIYFARTDNPELQDLGMFERWVNPASRLYGPMAVLQATSYTDSKTSFYILDATSGELMPFTPPQALGRCDLYSAKKTAEGLELFYGICDTNTGNTQSYQWNTADATQIPLPGNVYLYSDQSFHLPMTHYIEYRGEKFAETGLQIRKFDHT